MDAWCQFCCKTDCECKNATATSSFPLTPPDDCYVHAGDVFPLCEACFLKLESLGFVEPADG